MRLISQRSFQKGIKQLIKANRILPHPNVQYNIAQAYLAAGDIQNALVWLRQYAERAASEKDAEQVRKQIAALEASVQPVITKPPPIEPQERPTQLQSNELSRLKSIADELEVLMQRLAQGQTLQPQKPPPEKTDPLEKPSTPLKESGLRTVAEYQEQKVVTAATRKAKSPKDAPAVVWVLTQRELRNRGYESIAEALKAVAGLHIIDDYAFVDVGVRGVHGGLRGMSRIIKVLVDGHPITFRPTSGNLLGPEGIPIRAIDRIELIRGPGSALYGANASLGVLQIVTRRGGDIRGGSVAGRMGFSTSTKRIDGTALPNISGSGDAIIGTQQGSLSMLLSAQFGRFDRSGHQIPETSPFALEFSRREDAGISADDRSTPLSFFGTLTQDFGKRGQLRLQSGLQRLDANAEWLDYGALTHFSRVSLINFWMRLSYDLPVSDNGGLRIFSSYSQGEPTDRHRIRPLEGFALMPDTTRHLTEDFRSQAVFSGLEMRWDLLGQRLNVRVGADLDVDLQRLTTASRVIDEEGVQGQPGDTIFVARSQSARETFTNVGLYLQVSSNPVSFFDIIGGLRYDFQSLYGSNLNGRLGMVFRANDWLYFKALYGSSFRAPAADQLFRGTAYVGDATGCLDYDPCAAVGLKPQLAHTGEVVAGISLDSRINAQVTGFVSFVDNLILSFPNRSNAFITTNAGERLSTGVELETNFKLPRFGGGFELNGHGYFAFQRTSSTIPETLFEPADSIRVEYREASLFPAVTGGGGLDLAFIPGKIGLYVEGRYVGPRRASGSNLALSLGSSNYANDEDLPGYFELDLNLSTRDVYFFDSGETVLSLRITDALGQPHAEGGFRGWDIPAPGRLIFFRVIQEF